MKKLALALMCLVSVAFFASCNEIIENPEPSIQVYVEDGYVTDGQSFDYVGDTIFVDFGFVMASNTQTNKKLASLVVKVDDVEWANKDLTGQTSYTYKDEVAYIFTREEVIGTSIITAVVTDEAGNTNTSAINITFNQGAQELVATPIEWVKLGHTVQDLSEYGLEWKTTNYKEPFTHIFPAEGCMLFACSGYGDDFETIKTDLDLAAYFNNLAEMSVYPETINTTEYNKIDCNPANKDYNDLLITKDNEGNFHAILIKNAKVTYTTATQITITGQAK
jgi:hypothetical protein